MTDVEFANFLHQVFGHLSASCHDGATETGASHTNITPFRYGLTRVFRILPPAPRTLVRVPCASLPDIPTVWRKHSELRGQHSGAPRRAKRLTATDARQDSRYVRPAKPATLDVARYAASLAGLWANKSSLARPICIMSDDRGQPRSVAWPS
jgi:hypothetical protein